MTQRQPRRRFLAALTSAALAAGAPGRIVAADPTKRVAIFNLLDLEEGEERKKVEKRMETNVARVFAELPRDAASVRVVPHLVAMRTDWEVTVPRAAREIAARRYDGAIVEGEYLVRRLQEAAPNLPIAAYLFDPVGHGFARSLAKPGGNVTGTHRGAREVYLKQIEILRRLVGRTIRMAWITWEAQLEQRAAAFEWAARTAGMEVRRVILDAKDDFRSLPRDFEALQRDGFRCGHYDAGLDPDLEAVSRLALRHRIALSFWGAPEDFDREGLLLQYRSLRDGVRDRLIAAMARILRGERPGDIPFEGPTKYQLRINLKTAARIGVKVPEDVLVMTDEVLR